MKRATQPRDIGVDLTRASLDMRSPAGKTSEGYMRLLVNAVVDRDKRMRRLGGWRALALAEPPRSGDEVPIVFAMLADQGSGDSNQQAVASLVSSWSPEFIVTAGDNIYGSYPGMPEEQLDSLFDATHTAMYGSVISRQRFYPAVGNHDTDYSDTWYRSKFPHLFQGGAKNYYRVRPDNGPIEFFVLSSGFRTNGSVFEPDGNTVGSAQYQWLAAAVASSTATWKVAVIHHAPYTSGSAYSPGIGESRWNFESLGIDLVVSGHEHNYERWINRSIPYIVTGHGGASLRGYSTHNPATSVISRATLCYASLRDGADICLRSLDPIYISDCFSPNIAGFGALRCTVTGTSLRVENVVVGGVVEDSVTIYKTTNEDLHDQLQVQTPEHITMLGTMRGDGGGTRLLAGTRSSIYCNTGLDANWRKLLFGKGGTTPQPGVPETRWKYVQVGAIAIFTNGLDHPYWWSYEKEPDSITGVSAELIDDLVAMDITSVGCLGAWNGVVFLGNCVTEGFTAKNRIYWSDFNDPLSFQPLPDSLAGYVDLNADEEVVAMEPIGGQFRVYTDKAIYDVNLVGGEEVFNFREIYRGPAAIRFRNSLVNIGDFHVYGGEDTLYVMGPLDRTPRTLDWMHRAAGAIFRGLPASLLDGIPESSIQSFGPINRRACHLLVGGYDEQNGVLWYSWAADEDIVPVHSLAMHIHLGTACIVDAGFTAMCSHLPSYTVSVRRWLADIGACRPYPVLKEGNPAPRVYVQNDSLLYIRNATEDAGLPVENGSSLCDLANDDPSIEPDCTPCGNGYKFIMAWSQDKCLKEFTRDYCARQRCDTPEASRSGLAWTEGAMPSHPTTAAAYSEVGYVSIAQSDAQDFGTPANKTVLKAAVEVDVPDMPDTDPAHLHCDVGYGAQPRQISWSSSAPRRVDSLRVLPGQSGIRANRFATYPFFRTGSQIAWRLMIADQNKGPVLGGLCSLNEMTVSVRQSHGDYV